MLLCHYILEVSMFDGIKILKLNEEYSIAENYILKLIQENQYPIAHPFNDYPNTPESMPIIMLIFIYFYTKNEKMIRRYVKKCKSIENGLFSYVKYNQEISELSWLYYLIIGIKEKNTISLSEIFDEDKAIIDNGKKFEYSFLFNYPKCIVSFEVKAITCDPFSKEENIEIEDGKKLIKPFFPQLKECSYLKKQTESMVLQSSTYYYQMEQNIKRIAAKCRGSNISGEKLYCFGTIFINSSTSFEEFYSYLFNSKYGLFSLVTESNIDVLTLVSFDAKNDLKLDNLYRNSYVQTFVVHPSEELLNICKALRLDNYIAVGDQINEYVLEKSKELFGEYKILCREGFLGIIPADADEEGIKEYVLYLQNNEIR